MCSFQWDCLTGDIRYSARRSHAGATRDAGRIFYHPREKHHRQLPSMLGMQPLGTDWEGDDAFKARVPPLCQIGDLSDILRALTPF